MLLGKCKIEPISLRYNKEEGWHTIECIEKTLLQNIGSGIECIDLIPSPVSNETNAKELFLPIIGELSKFITRPICFPNNEYWYDRCDLSILSE